MFCFIVWQMAKLRERLDRGFKKGKENGKEKSQFIYLCLFDAFIDSLSPLSLFSFSLFFLNYSFPHSLINPIPFPSHSPPFPSLSFPPMVGHPLPATHRRPPPSDIAARQHFFFLFIYLNF